MTRDEIKHLRDLEDEVESLRRRLRSLTGSDSGRWHALGLTPSEERIARLLMLRAFASYEAINSALYWDKDSEGEPKVVHVLVSHLRSKLPFLRPFLRNVASRGYALSVEGKHRLAAELIFRAERTQ